MTIAFYFETKKIFKSNLVRVLKKSVFNPFYSSVSIHVFYTSLRTFLLILTWGICLEIKGFRLMIISFILMILLTNHSAVLQWEEI